MDPAVLPPDMLCPLSPGLQAGIPDENGAFSEYP